MTLIVAPVVEGHGEVECVRPLLERIWYEQPCVVETLIVEQPYRLIRSQMIRRQSLAAAITAAGAGIRRRAARVDCPRSFVLLILDADNDCPGDLARGLLDWCREDNGHIPVRCVLPKPEFETWFVASAAALIEAGLLKPDTLPPDDPEPKHLKKKWIADHALAHYDEVKQMSKFVAAMDLSQAHARPPSFRKLCRDLQAFARP